MTLDTSDLVIKIALAFAFVFAIVIFIILLRIFGIKFKRKDKSSFKDETKTITKKVLTTGKQLNQVYQFSVYFLIFSILIIFLILSYSLFQTDTQLIDIWPFLFLIVILILYCLVIIEKPKIQSKRITQRDMRE